MARPRKFEKLDDLEPLVEEYFTTPKPWTILGLALHLDIGRDTLIAYQEREEFSYTIKKAKAKIEQDKWQGLLTGRYNTAGAIFDLKNNHGAEDKTKTETLKTVYKVKYPGDDD